MPHPQAEPTVWRRYEPLVRNALAWPRRLLRALRREAHRPLDDGSFPIETDHVARSVVPHLQGLPTFGPVPLLLVERHPPVTPRDPHVPVPKPFPDLLGSGEPSELDEIDLLEQRAVVLQDRQTRAIGFPTTREAEDQHPTRRGTHRRRRREREFPLPENRLRRSCGERLVTFRPERLEDALHRTALLVPILPDAEVRSGQGLREVEIRVGTRLDPFRQEVPFPRPQPSPYEDRRSIPSRDERDPRLAPFAPRNPQLLARLGLPQPTQLHAVEIEVFAIRKRREHELRSRIAGKAAERPRTRPVRPRVPRPEVRVVADECARRDPHPSRRGDPMPKGRLAPRDPPKLPPLVPFSDRIGVGREGVLAATSLLDLRPRFQKVGGWVGHRLRRVVSDGARTRD